MASTTPTDISALPAVGQIVFHQDTQFQTIKEGRAHILIPASASADPMTIPRGNNETQPVFYNPIQQYNRDLSVLAIKAYGEGILSKRFQTLQEGTKRKGKRHPEIDQRRKVRKHGGEQQFTSDSFKPPAEDAPVTTHASSSDHLELNKQVSASPSMTVETLRSNEAKPISTSAGAEREGSLQHEERHSVDASIPRVESHELANKKPPRFTILDALSATGLRALRYAHEIPFTTSITANDLLPSAVDNIKMNVKHNRLEERIKTTTANAVAYMCSLGTENEQARSKRREKFDVIDLDPYGTAVPFLDAAVQAVRNGGLLCVTCTDAGVWASNSYPEKAYSLYGGVTSKGFHSHEAGLRLILHAIATTAARHGLAIEPLLSLSIDFYARVFVRIYDSPSDVKFLAGKTMLVYNCDSGCGAWSTQMIGRNKLQTNKSGKGFHWKHVYAQGPSASEYCGHCGSRTHIGGPMYAGPIHSADFIRKILSDLPGVDQEIYYTKNRIEGMLTLALDELLPEAENHESPTASSRTGKYDPSVIDRFPFFFKPDVLAKVLHCTTPSESAIRGALKGLGYRVTRSHTKPGSIKTDAPWSVIWEVMKEWERQRAPVKDGAIRRGTAGWAILGLDKDGERVRHEAKLTSDVSEQVGMAKKTSSQDSAASKCSVIVFDEKLGSDPERRKIVRYQLNPRENWGPMQKAKGPG